MTVSARNRWRRPRPMEPPMSPTPAMTTFRNRGAGRMPAMLLRLLSFIPDAILKQNHAAGGVRLGPLQGQPPRARGVRQQPQAAEIGRASCRERGAAGV